jgi:hypothetical protein
MTSFRLAISSYDRGFGLSAAVAAFLAALLAGCVSTSAQQAATADGSTPETPEQVLASVSEDPTAGTNATAEEAGDDLGIVIPDDGAKDAAATTAAAGAAPAPQAAPSLPAEDAVPQAALPQEATTALAPETSTPAAAPGPAIDPRPVPTAGAKPLASAKGKPNGAKAPHAHRDDAANAMGSVGERVLRFVAKEDAKVFSAPQASANVLGRLDRGERVFVVIEAGGWGRVAGDRFVKLADLSTIGVARQRQKAAWTNGASSEARP